MWLCNETGGLWVREAGGEKHPSSVQESSPLHAIHPFPAPRKEAVLGERIPTSKKKNCTRHFLAVRVGVQSFFHLLCQALF